MTRKKWATDEIVILQEYWPQGGLRACLPHLQDEEPRRIETKAYNMGLKVDGRKPYKRIQWTDFIDRQIKAAYASPKLGILKATAKQLDIPYGAMRIRAAEKGYIVRHYNRPWEPAEDEVVQQCSGNGLRWIRQKLKQAGFQRSMAAISTRRCQLDCSGNDNADPDRLTATQLAQLCGIDSHVVLNWIKRGYLKAVRDEALYTPTPKPNAFWYIRTKDFRKFVRNYPTLIELRKVNQPWFLDVVLGPPALNDKTSNVVSGGND